MPSITGTVTSDGAAAAGRIVRAYRRDTGALLSSTLSSDGTTQDGDPHYSSVSLLLRGDGANGSNPVDSSSTTKAVIRNGTSTVSTSQSKFGGSSIQFGGGTTNFLQLASNADFNFGTGDFTLEAWVYITANPASPYAAILDISDGSGGSGRTLMMLDESRTLGYFFGAAPVRTTTSISLNAWTHCALCRGANTVRLFINGVQGASVADTTTKVQFPCFVGRVANAAWAGYAGFLDDVRITKGVARYTSAFTPPLVPFADDLPPPAPLALGAYYIDTPFAGEVQVVCLDDTAGPVYNDLILRTTPV